MLTYGEVTLNPVSCTTTYSGQPVKLNPKEYLLLEVFLRYPTHVLSYEAIIDRVWQGESVPTYGCIRTHIKRIRKAFKGVGYPGEVIENVHGLGYRLGALPDQKNAVIRPSSAVLQKFFSTKAIEYLVLEGAQIIHYLSPGAVNYSDHPESLQIGASIVEGFPEFVGLEDTLNDIRNQARESFELRGVGRSYSQQRPEYVNFYVVADREVSPSDRLFVFLEDASEQMRARQRLVQRSNETILLLERLQVAPSKHSS